MQSTVRPSLNSSSKIFVLFTSFPPSFYIFILIFRNLDSEFLIPSADLVLRPMNDELLVLFTTHCDTSHVYSSPHSASPHCFLTLSVTDPLSLPHCLDWGQWLLWASWHRPGPRPSHGHAPYHRRPGPHETWYFSDLYEQIIFIIDFQIVKLSLPTFIYFIIINKLTFCNMEW